MKASPDTERNRRRRTKILPTYMQVKLAITLSVFLLAFLALIYVIYRQIRQNNEEYNRIVLSQRQASYDSRTIPFRRGNIMDRNGTLLATSQKVYNLILDPKLILSGKEQRYLDATVRALEEYFQYDAAEIRTLLTEKSGKSYLKYRKELGYDEKAVSYTHLTLPTTSRV